MMQWRRFLRVAVGQELVRVSLAGVGIRATGAACGFLFNVVLARALGKAGTGTVMLYLNFATMIGLIATAGMDVVGLRELSRRVDDRVCGAIVLGNVLSGALPSVLLFSIGGFVFLSLFGRSLAGSGDIWLYLICTLALAFTAFQKMFSDWLIALREFAPSQLVFYFLNRVISVVLLLPVMVLGISRGALSDTFVCIYAAGLLVAVLYAIRRISTHFSGRAVRVQFLPAMPLRDSECGVHPLEPFALSAPGRLFYIFGNRFVRRITAPRRHCHSDPDNNIATGHGRFFARLRRSGYRGAGSNVDGERATDLCGRNCAKPSPCGLRAVLGFGLR
jgi:hypothetical protein